MLLLIEISKQIKQQKNRANKKKKTKKMVTKRRSQYKLI